MPHLRDGYEAVLNNMEVYVQSRISRLRLKCTTVAINSNATVDSLISTFCGQNNIACCPEFILFNGNNELLKGNATLASQGVTEGSLLFLDSKTRLVMSAQKWGFLAIITMIIGTGGLLAVLLVYFLSGRRIPFDYAVVIDAGSTHSQMLLYEWSGDKDHGTADVIQHDTCGINGGVANMKNPEDILPCVNKMVESIPSGSRLHSHLYLGATAGMRLLNISLPRAAELTLLTLKCTLEKTGITVKRVDIISGFEEGTDAWITTNFLKKTLHPPESSEPWKITFGSLDMGGASTQYAFAINPDHAPNSSSLANIRLYGHDYVVTAGSYLCYGFMESSRRHQAILVTNLNGTEPIYDPCLPKGNATFVTAQYLFDQPCTRTTKSTLWLTQNPLNKDKVFEFVGGSDYENCSALIKEQLSESVCKRMGFQECAAPPPLFLTEKKFFAVSSYYYITSFLNSTTATLEELTANIKKWCATSWPEMADLPLPLANRARILTYCFGGNYIVQWLNQIYGFNESTWENIIFQDKIGQNDLGWALGFMINASNAIPVETPTPRSLSSATFAVLVMLFMFVIFVSLVLIRKFMIQRRQERDPEVYRRLIEV